MSPLYPGSGCSGTFGGFGTDDEVEGSADGTEDEEVEGTEVGAEGPADGAEDEEVEGPEVGDEDDCV